MCRNSHGKTLFFLVRVKIIQNNIVHVFNSYNFTGPKSHCQWEVSMIVLLVKSHMNWLLFSCHLTFFIIDMEEKIIPSLNDYWKLELAQRQEVVGKNWRRQVMDRDQSGSSGHIKQCVQTKINSYRDCRATRAWRASPLCKLAVIKISIINLDLWAGH